MSSAKLRSLCKNNVMKVVTKQSRTCQKMHFCVFLILFVASIRCQKPSEHVSRTTLLVVKLYTHFNLLAIICFSAVELTFIQFHFAGRACQENLRRFTNGPPLATEHDFAERTDGGNVDLDSVICQLGKEMAGPGVGEFGIGNGRLSGPGRPLHLGHHLHPIDSPHQPAVSVVGDCQEETQRRSR